LKIFEACTLLDKFHKNSSMRFINQFYDLIEKGDQAKNTILHNCN
jgi:hypothetical protein